VKVLPSIASTKQTKEQSENEYTKYTQKSFLSESITKFTSYLRSLKACLQLPKAGHLKQQFRSSQSRKRILDSIFLHCRALSHHSYHKKPLTTDYMVYTISGRS